jgi:hypothetical protein
LGSKKRTKKVRLTLPVKTSISKPTALNKKSEDERLELTDSLMEMWRIFLREQNHIFFLVGALKSRQEEFYEESLKEAETVTEEAFKNQELVFPPDIYVKLTKTKPYLVEKFPTLLNQLTLIRAVSSFEYFLNRSIEAILDVYPELIDEDKKSKKEPLRAQMGSLKPFDAKIPFVKGCENGAGLHINLNRPAFRESQLIEIHQTRHILVHNLGYVDAGYITKVPGTEFKDGQRRSLSDEYVTESLHALNNAVSHLLFEFLERFCGVAI